jgi:hypothetical protein
MTQENLVALFGRIGNIFRRLEIHSQVPQTTAMMDIRVKIMVKVITILGIATKEVRCGRLGESIPRSFVFID